MLDCKQCNLNLTVLMQTADQIGVVKGGELLGSPEAGNQQPSLSGNTLEGSTTNSRGVTEEDASNADTSALQPEMVDDIV